MKNDKCRTVNVKCRMAEGYKSVDAISAENWLFGCNRCAIGEQAPIILQATANVRQARQTRGELSMIKKVNKR